MSIANVSKNDKYFLYMPNHTGMGACRVLAMLIKQTQQFGGTVIPFAGTDKENLAELQNIHGDITMLFVIGKLSDTVRKALQPIVGLVVHITIDDEVDDPTFKCLARITPCDAWMQTDDDYSLVTLEKLCTAIGTSWIGTMAKLNALLPPKNNHLQNRGSAPVFDSIISVVSTINEGLGWEFLPATPHISHIEQIVVSNVRTLADLAGKSFDEKELPKFAENSEAPKPAAPPSKPTILIITTEHQVYQTLMNQFKIALQHCPIFKEFDVTTTTLHNYASREQLNKAALIMLLGETPDHPNITKSSHLEKMIWLTNTSVCSQFRQKHSLNVRNWLVGVVAEASLEGSISKLLLICQNEQYQWYWRILFEKLKIEWLTASTTPPTKDTNENAHQPQPISTGGSSAGGYGGTTSFPPSLHMTYSVGGAVGGVGNCGGTTKPSTSPNHNIYFPKMQERPNRSPEPKTVVIDGLEPEIKLLGGNWVCIYSRAIPPKRLRQVYQDREPIYVLAYCNASVDPNVTGKRRVVVYSNQLHSDMYGLPKQLMKALRMPEVLGAIETTLYDDGAGGIAHEYYLLPTKKPNP